MDEDRARALAAELGRYFAAKRVQVSLPCVVCGAELRGLKTRRYCSNACRQRAKRQRAKSTASVGARHDGE